VAPFRPKPRGRWAALFVPDLALAGALAALVYCLLIFEGYRKLFRDSDAGWHIRTGEAILATGELPRADPYSFTLSGAPWFAWEWASDVLMGGAHQVLGLTGVAILYSAAIAFSVWLWFRLHWRAGGDFLLACLLAAPMLSTCNLHWLARPHIFSWLFLLGAVWWAEGEHRRFTWRDAAFAGAGTALWANLHASFFFAPLIAFLYAAGHWLGRLIWDLDEEAERARGSWFLAAAAVSAAASLVNPYGWGLHRHLFAYLTDSELLARVGEFQSFNFHADGAAQILAALGISMLGAVLLLAERKLGAFFVSALLIAAALRSARTLPVVALLVLPLANGAIRRALTGLAGLRPAAREAIGGALAYSSRLRAIDAGLGGLGFLPVPIVILFGILLLPAVKARTGFPPDQFPVAASAALDRLVPEEARVLAPDMFGGYVIYRFAGRRKVFFDGRSDLYGAAFMKRYARLVQVRPGWEKDIEEFAFGFALLPNDYSLVEALERLNWKRLYRDNVATLLSRP
jgi:hypothetical protein